MAAPHRKMFDAIRCRDGVALIAVDVKILGNRLHTQYPADRLPVERVNVAVFFYSSRFAASAECSKNTIIDSIIDSINAIITIQYF